VNVGSHRTCKTLFFAGTDTDVGKTYVAALVAQALAQTGNRVGVYKPVASGCHRSEKELVAADARRLWIAAGRPGRLDDVCPQRFEAALAPPEAAQLESRQVDASLLRSGAQCWETDSEVLIVEGAGGLLSPLADDVLNVDLVQQFSPVRLIIVAANRLGAVHKTLATIEASFYRGIRPDAVVLSNVSHRPDESSLTNLRQIAKYSDVPVVGPINYEATQIDGRILQQICG
jgi:dethiobiotin synthetase